MTYATLQSVRLILAGAALTGCAAVDARKLPGEYAFVEAALTAEGTTDTARAGQQGAYGSMVLHPGGKLTGEARVPLLPDSIEGSWYADTTGLRLSIFRVGSSILAQVDRSGRLTFGTGAVDPRARAYVIAMKSDLRMLVAAEESYFSDAARYTPNWQSLSYFRPSAGVSAPSITVGRGSWQATVGHERLPGIKCGIAVNAANPVDPTASEGEPVCTALDTTWGRLSLQWQRTSRRD